MAKKIIIIIISIIVVVSVILGELLYKKRSFHYEDHLDDVVISVDAADISLREFGYYIYKVEEYVQKQAVLYDADNPRHWWNTHFAAGADSTFVCDYAKQTAINTCICNEIYYREAINNGLTLTEEEESSAIRKAKDTYSQMDSYQRKVTGLNEMIVTDLARKEARASKYALYLAQNADFGRYTGDPAGLLNWDGDYYINEIMPGHAISQNNKVLDEIILGKITVNYN